MPSLTPATDDGPEIARQRVAKRPALGTSRIKSPTADLAQLARDARGLRYRRRQASSEWLIGAARRQAGLPAVAADGDRSWVRPPRPARCRWRIAAQVGVHHSEGRHGHWSGLERCASIWACPVCSAVIRAERSREIQHAVDAWASQGGRTLMVTLTLRHRLRDPLDIGLEAAITGWKNLIRGGFWSRLRRRVGVIGAVRAVEVTWTEANGWHPHIHALLFAERDLAEGEVTALEDALYDAWARIVTRLGARRPDRAHGVRITRGAADYLAKVQEHDRAGVEMTRFDLKRSRSAQGFMPFELLDVEGDDQGRARRLWWEYVDATKGRRAITWSRGLKARFGVDERSDDEVIDDAQQDDLRMLIPGEDYDRRLRNAPGRATAVLELVEAGDLALAARIAGGLLAAAPVEGVALGDAPRCSGSRAGPRLRGGATDRVPARGPGGPSHGSHDQTTGDAT